MLHSTQPVLREDFGRVRARGPLVPAFLASVPGRFRRRMSGGVYQAEIDGLRFIAIAIVIIGHFTERALRFFPTFHDQAAGYIVTDLMKRAGEGVFLFFAISGFIIASQVIRGNKPPLSLAFLRPYFGRRVLRIEPPYVILLVATWLFISLSGYSPDQTAHFESAPQSLSTSLFGSIIYVHGLVWGSFPRLFPPGWSLEAEVQFYILAPLLFWAYFGMARGPARIALGLAGLLIGTLSSIVAPATIGPLHLDYSILRFFHYFWLGIVLADLRGWIVDRMKGLPSTVSSLIGWGGLALYVGVPGSDVFEVTFALRVLALASIAAMFTSAFLPGSSFRTFCVNPWISLIGGACYSIYLVHLQVIQVMMSVFARLAPSSGIMAVVAMAALAFAVVVAAGLVFYGVIERSFMIPNWPTVLWRRVRRDRSAGSSLRAEGEAT